MDPTAGLEDMQSRKILHLPWPWLEPRPLGRYTGCAGPVCLFICGLFKYVVNTPDYWCHPEELEKTIPGLRDDISGRVFQNIVTYK
jgi:hypothetical protein